MFTLALAPVLAKAQTTTSDTTTDTTTTKKSKKKAAKDKQRGRQTSRCRRHDAATGRDGEGRHHRDHEESQEEQESSCRQDSRLATRRDGRDGDATTTKEIPKSKKAAADS